MQVDGGQEQDVLRQQVERCRAVVALLFPPFEAVPAHILWTLYGWLELWFTPGTVAGATTHYTVGTEDAKGAIDIVGSLKTAENNAEDSVRATQESTTGADSERVVSGMLGMPAEHGQQVGSAAARDCLLPEGGGSKRWRLFAAMLHDMVAAAGNGHAHMFREEQEERKSEIEMLRESITAHKV